MANTRLPRHGGVNWMELKHDYFMGMQPRELALKYGITTQQVKSKICMGILWVDNL